MGQKRGGVHLPGCGGVCVAVSGSAHRQCPSLRQSGGSQIQPQGTTCSRCTKMYSLNSIVFDFSCQNCSRCEFCLRTRGCCAGGAPGFATRCKAGSMPHGFQVSTPLVLGNCQLQQMCVSPVTSSIWLWDSSSPLPVLICASNICSSSSLVFTGVCISATSEETVFCKLLTSALGCQRKRKTLTFALACAPARTGISALPLRLLGFTSSKSREFPC